MILTPLCVLSFGFLMFRLTIVDSYAHMHISPFLLSNVYVLALAFPAFNQHLYYYATSLSSCPSSLLIDIPFNQNAT